MLSEAARAALRDMFARPAEAVSVEESRRGWEAAVEGQAMPADAWFATVDAGGVPAEWMKSEGADPRRVMVLLHGGGHNSGSPRTHRRMAYELSRAARVRVLTPDYALAPERRFPAGLEDAVAVMRWLGEQGIVSRNLVVAGDSSGGGLALALLLAMRERGMALPAGAVLMSPWTDLTQSGASIDALAARDPLVSRAGLERAAKLYAGDDRTASLVSPLFADLHGLPPMLVQVGGDEVLLDDSRRLGERARAAGVPMTVTEHEGMWHVFQLSDPDIPEVAAAYGEIGDWVRKRLA